MFLLKKIVAPLLLPSSLSLEILLFGLILLWSSRRQKAGRILATLAAMMLFVFSYGGISDRLLRPLERSYPPLRWNAAPDSRRETVLSPVKWIVVLGGGHSSDPGISMESQLTSPSVSRLLEGLRLYRALPGTKLVLSGGEGFDTGTDAEAMLQLALSLGVKKEDIVLETQSRDTEEQAKLIEPRVGRSPFILVTSALHMPRSMAVFRRLGMSPIPAPAHFQAPESAGFGPDDFYPSPIALEGSDSAVHEYLGLLWAKLRGKA